MSSLNNPALSFRVPNTNVFDRGIQTVRTTDDSYPVESPKIYQGSVLIKELGVLSEANKTIIDQIKSFEFLENNWDDDGAKTIPVSTINKSIDLVNAIDENNIDVYLVSPGPNQEILLMLKNNNREIELIIYPSKEKYVKFENSNFIEQGNLNNKEFSLILEWLL